MREIEYRGKRIDNGEWVYGYYVRYEHLGNVKHIIVTDWAQVYVNSYYVIPETVGQFTGQHDKNGKEIYEGHILQDKRKRKFKVTWNNDIGSWVNSPCEDSKSYPCFNIGTVKDLVIIGNIFENPELLESEGGIMYSTVIERTEREDGVVISTIALNYLPWAWY